MRSRPWRPQIGWAGRWSSPGPPVSLTRKNYRHDINEVLLNVALNTIKQTNNVVILVIMSVSIYITSVIIFFFSLSLLSPLEHVISKIQHYIMYMYINNINFMQFLYFLCKMFMYWTFFNKEFILYILKYMK
jgi:hypothetical protein